MTPPAVRLDERGGASLGGTWEFHPGDVAVGALESVAWEAIQVPGLWEAQGHLELDGVAWYRYRFSVDEADAPGWWTLRFGAVMDLAEVHLNGRRVGGHEAPFTPFELDVTGVLAGGSNDLAVRVTDPAAGDAEHLRLPHGKQGWASAAFPSPPSLYLTYGGIWQPVTLRRHGPVAVTDVFVSGDPEDLAVAVEVANRSTDERRVRVGVHAAGTVAGLDVVVGPGAVAVGEARLGPTQAARWSPRSPTLHTCLVEAFADGAPSDARSVRFGLRRVRVEGDRLTVDGEPYRMRSALVQGFHPDRLYAEGDRAEIEAEVRAALAMGFNTLRLHVKAFDPAYLDVCDELGMYLHCDLPVAEPLAHDELGSDTGLARRCVTAATEQVRRDRNHPSVLLWSAMNEVGVERDEARSWPAYEAFARTLVAAVRAADPTRPVIENDWVDPDPDRVHAADVLTAHWYGRLTADHLDRIESSCARWAGLGRPLFVTEFGDWGLPDRPALPDPPFRGAGATGGAGVEATPWPGTSARFAAGTQRYQGLSDRLQAEVFRRHDHIGGYCVTELTDVPAEHNGLLDLHRRPKPAAVAEMARANQVVLPMLRLGALAAVAEDLVRAPVHVANDGPPLEDVEIEARFGDTPASDEPVWALRVAELPGWRPTTVGEAVLAAPEVPGHHDLVVTLRAGGRAVAANRYPVRVVSPPHAPYAVQALGGGDVADALAAVGAKVGEEGPAFVAEGGLAAGLAADVRDRLAAGATVVVLAQPPSAGPCYPLPVVLEPVEAVWGPTVFHFTTGSGRLPSLPRREVLATEDASISPEAVVAAIGGRTFSDEPVVVAHRPPPAALAATVVGGHVVGRGRLVVCQYRLTRRAVDRDPTALALLRDLVCWAADPTPPMGVEEVRKEDGRSMTYYSFPPGWDR